MDRRDRLILVNERDEVLGYETRAACHSGKGLLHRAFSVYVFDGEDRLLLQRRGLKKTLWPGYWSNSCCSHPTADEDPESAARRRVEEELGFSTLLSFAFKYQYQAAYEGIGSENELCSVYFGRHAGAVHPSSEEVLACRHASIAEITEELRRHPADFTPWFRIAWERIRADHLHVLAAL